MLSGPLWVRSAKGYAGGSNRRQNYKQIGRLYKMEVKTGPD